MAGSAEDTSIDTKVIRLGKPHIKEAGEVLSRAFYDDPLFTHYVPDDARRMRLLPWSMAAGVRYGRLYGEVYTSAEQIDGVAVWLAPGNSDMSLLRMIRVGMVLAPLKLGLGAFSRFMNAGNYFEELHKRSVEPHHWYMLFLGVDPPRQGRGHGSALLQPMLARIDAENVPSYLETSKPNNVPFWQRHGFEVAAEGDVPDGGPHVWGMRREPRGW